jgi:hypothetical protein
MTLEELKSAHQHKQPMVLEDPVLARTPLPHHATFFPLGFPLEIRTNSPEVLDCAAESWLGYPHLFPRKPIQLRIIVQGSNLSECPPAPSFRGHGHLLLHVADIHNYSAIDLSQQSAVIFVTPSAVRHHSYFRYFFLEAAALAPISTCYTTAIHAGCVELDGKGVLLCGDSGAGKSTLSYACAQAGWTYISDDASFLLNGRTDRFVVGNFRQVRFRPSAVDLFPTLEGHEIIHRAESGKPSIELSIGSNRTLKRAPSCHIRHIVFLHRGSIRHSQLINFPRELARQYIQQTSSWLPEVQSENTSLIDTLLHRPTLELRYQDLSWAIERLTQLVHEDHL